MTSYLTTTASQSHLSGFSRFFSLNLDHVLILYLILKSYQSQEEHTQIFLCSKPIMETPEQCVKSVQS